MSRKPLLLFGLVICFCLRPVCAQTGAQKNPSLKGFFQELVEHYDVANLPPFEGLLAVQDQVPGLSARELAEALPWADKAISYPDDTVRKYGAAVMFSVARRADGLSLLDPYLGGIGRLLDSRSTSADWRDPDFRRSPARSSQETIAFASAICEQVGP